MSRVSTAEALKSVFKDTELDIFKDKLLSKNNLSYREKRLVQHLTETRISDRMDLQFFGSPEKQFGKKVGKHAADFGLDASKKEDREKFRAITSEIINNHDQLLIGKFNMQEDEILFHIKNNVVVSTSTGRNELNKVIVLTSQKNEFISVIVLKEGEENAWVKKARTVEI